MPYDPLKDFSHATLAVSVPNAVVIHPSVPANNMKELIAASIKSPNGYAFASPGNGSVGHLTGEMLRMTAVTSGRRAASQPDLPTIAESGVPGFEATGWYGFVGPVGLPCDRVAKINAEIAK